MKMNVYSIFFSEYVYFNLFFKLINDMNNEYVYYENGCIF